VTRVMLRGMGIGLLARRTRVRGFEGCLPNLSNTSEIDSEDKVKKDCQNFYALKLKLAELT
jgi:hypothetical protein